VRLLAGFLLLATSLRGGFRYLTLFAESTGSVAIALRGTGFASLVDGVPTDFTVQTWDGARWLTQATITGNTSLYRWIPFPATVSTTQVRVVVTGSQAQNGTFTRVAEVTP
jgi:alpha-L-rhamnosidase